MKVEESNSGGGVIGVHRRSGVVKVEGIVQRVLILIHNIERGNREVVNALCSRSGVSDGSGG